MDGCYVADGSGNRILGKYSCPTMEEGLSKLSHRILADYCDYLNSVGFSSIAKFEDISLSFAFTPPCDAIMDNGGDIYTTHKINENEQQELFEHLKREYDSLDDVIE